VDAIGPVFYISRTFIAKEEDLCLRDELFFRHLVSIIENRRRLIIPTTEST